MKKLFLWMAILMSALAGPLAAASSCPEILAQYTAVPYVGKGQPGDILVTLKVSGYIVGFNPQAQTWYLFSTATAGSNLDGIWPKLGNTSNLLLSNEGLDKIQELDPNGNILGTYGTSVGPKIGAYNPSDGSLWVPEQATNRLWRIPAGGGTGVVASNSSLLNGGTGAVYDNSGNLYVTNDFTGTILKFPDTTSNPAAPTASTFASGMNQLGGVVYGGDGYLYAAGFSAPNSAVVWKVSTATGAVAVWTQNFAPLTQNGGGSIYVTDGIVMDLDGNLWIIQMDVVGGNRGLLKINTADGVPLAYYAMPDTIDGISGMLASSLDDMAVVGMGLPRHECATFTSTPTATPTSTAVPPCPEILSQYTAVPYVGNGQPGDIIISLKANGRLLGLNPTTQSFYMFSTVTAGSGLLDGITVNINDTNKLEVSVDSTGLVKEVDSTGALVGTYTSIAGAPKITAFNPADGSFWIPDQLNHKMWRVPGGGGPAVAVSTGGLLSAPTGCAFDNLGNFYVTNNGNGKVLKCTNATSSPLTPSFTVLASLSLQLQGVIYGGDGFLYTPGYPGAPPYNGTIFKVNCSTGASTAMTSSFSPLSENSGGVLYNPDGLVMDLNGYLWVVLRHGAGNDIGGMLKIDPATGTPLVYLALPDTVDGFTGNLNSQPDDACVLGLGLPRHECGTLTMTPTATPTATPSDTATPTATYSLTPTPTPTPSPTPTSTLTPTATYSGTSTATNTATPTQTYTQTLTQTATGTSTPTAVPTAAVDCHTHKAIKIPSNLLNGGRSSFDILVKAMETGEARVDIYHEGVLVRTLWSGRLAKCGTKVLSWDLRDDRGYPVASGVYTGVFRDASGGLFKENCVVVR